MINKYYGGSISQDRLSYECWQNEDDANSQIGQLGHGTGIDNAEALAWSLFPPKDEVESDIADVYFFEETKEQKWDVVANAVLHQRQVIISRGKHATIICGVRKENGIKWVHWFDPAKGVKWEKFDNIYLEIFTATYVKDDLNIDKKITPRKDEAEVSADSDKDKIADFDEMHRFKPLKLNPKKWDDKTKIKNFYNVK